MNRFEKLFDQKKKNILNIYFTAGHPTKNSLPQIIGALTESGTDIIEIGMPYSDPLADGKTIQDSSQIALNNGITLDIIFEQIKETRKTVLDTPFVLMGYYNQVLQYGISRFLESCKSAGVDGLIIPDLPMNVFNRNLKVKLTELDIKISFLVTPQTSVDRIRQADELSTGFLYVVSQSSITGKTSNTNSNQNEYFVKLQGLDLKSPKLIGFGIHDHSTFQNACNYAQGAIIGSAFIRNLEKYGASSDSIRNFVQSILN